MDFVFSCTYGVWKWAPLYENLLSSGAEYVRLFPVAEEKVASMEVGVTWIFFVRVAGRTVKRVFNLVTV